MRLQGRQDKGWGHEQIWATTDLYCGKIMTFHAGSKFSMHFHAHKDESGLVQSGEFLVRWIDTRTAELHERVLAAGDTWHNPPLQPHQLVCYRAGSVLEVSTADSVEDNYRVMPGDSQKNAG